MMLLMSPTLIAAFLLNPPTDSPHSTSSLSINGFSQPTSSWNSASFCTDPRDSYQWLNVNGGDGTLRLKQSGVLRGRIQLETPGALDIVLSSSPNIQLPSSRATCSLTGACGACLDGFQHAAGPTFEIRVTAGALLSIAAVPASLGSSPRGTLSL